MTITEQCMELLNHLYYTPETNTTLYVSYTGIEVKNLMKKWSNYQKKNHLRSCFERSFGKLTPEPAVSHAGKDKQDAHLLGTRGRMSSTRTGAAPGQGTEEAEGRWRAGLAQECAPGRGDGA